MNETEGAYTPRKPNLLWILWQWLVAACFALLTLVMLVASRHVGAPGAPVALFWSATAVTALVVVLAAPLVFFRLPRLGKALSYLGLPAAFVLAGLALGQTQEAYDRTPAGQKEKAANQAEAAKAAKAAKAEGARLAKANAAQAEEDRQAKHDDVCKSLIPQVVEMAQSERGVEIIEVNNVFASSERLNNQELTCFADAITSVGNKSITFGLEKTPQGQVLVTFQMPR